MKACGDFLLAYRAYRFYQGVGLTEDIYFPEENTRGIVKLFFGKSFAALTDRIFLSDRPSVENLIRIDRNKLFFFVCHILI
jgi:hypothetical protein